MPRFTPSTVAGPLVLALWTACAFAGTEAPDDEAADEPRLHWAPYRRFQAFEYVITFGTPVAFRVINHQTHEASAPRWRGPILFDEPTRAALRIRSRGGVQVALRASDVGWYASMAWPIIDATVFALALDGNPDVAWQLSAITLQAYALSGFFSLTTIRAVARERPSD